MYSLTIKCPTLATLVELAKVIDSNGLQTLGVPSNLEKDVEELNAPVEKKVRKVTPKAPGNGQSDPITEVRPATTFDNVRDVTLKLRDSVSKEAVKEVLKVYGVEKITELKEVQYVGYVGSCNDRMLQTPADDLGV